MVFLGFIGGLWLAVRRGKAVGIPQNIITDLTVWIMISSLVGARLTYVLFNLSEFKGRWLDTISPVQSDGTIGIGGLVILGGVAVAIPVSAYFLKKHKIPFLKMADVMMPPLALGIAIGRIGCFLNGCCFGIPTDLPWGIKFPKFSLAGSVYPDEFIHPTQIYESLYSLIIMFILLWRTHQRRFEGELMFIFLILYGIFRFFNEMLRHCESSMLVWGPNEGVHLTASMLASLVMVAIGVFYWVKFISKTKKL